MCICFRYIHVFRSLIYSYTLYLFTCTFHIHSHLFMWNKSSAFQKQASYSFCTRQWWLKSEYFIVVNHTARSLGTRAIWIGINECFPIFCCFCNELYSSPANHFSEGRPTLQLFSSIHRSWVLRGLCLLPHVELLLSHKSSPSALWTFLQSHPCVSSALSSTRSAQEGETSIPQSPFSHQLLSSQITK